MVLYCELHGALRRYRRHPLPLTVFAMLVGAAAGAIAAALWVAYPALLRPLPFADSSRVVALWESTDAGLMDVSMRDARDLQVASGALSEIGYSQPWEPVLTGRGQAAVIEGASVTPGFLRILGMAPSGTWQSAWDGAGCHVVVSNGFWSRYFAGERFEGQTLDLDGKGCQIIGVAPAGTEFPRRPEPAEIWRPLVLSPKMQSLRIARGLRAVARLSPGLTFAEAGARLRSEARRLARLYPSSNRGIGVRIQRLRDAVIGGKTEAALWMLLLVSGLVATVACFDAAWLAVASATRRRGEAATRAALGASRWQRAAPELADAVLGSGLGLGLACLASFAWMEFASRYYQLGGGLPGRGLLLAAAAVAVVLAWLCQIPAALASAALVGNSGRAGRSSLRRLSLAAQATFAVIAIASSLFMLLTVRAILGQPLGFSSTQLLQARVDLASAAYSAPAARLRYFDRALAALGRIPGVAAAAAVRPLPWGSTLGEGWAVGNSAGSAEFVACTGGYFSVLGVRLEAGRSFGPSDTRSGPKVVVVNAAMAQMLRRDTGRAVGTTIRVEDFGDALVVGVVGDFRSAGYTQAAGPTVFAPLSQVGQPFAGIVVRGAPASRLRIRQALSAIDPAVPVGLSAMSTVMSLSISQQVLASAMLTALALMALGLAFLGAYASSAESSLARRREMGIRAALGAEPGRIFLELSKESALSAVAGAAVGALLGKFAVRWLAPLIWGVALGDAWVLAASAVLGAGVMLLALIPQAAKVSVGAPAKALREGR